MHKYAAMTSAEINAIPVGPELDSLVAEKVFGWKHLVGDEVPELYRHAFADGPQEIWLDDETGLRFCKWCCSLPRYSADISAAFEVVEEMHDCLHLREYSSEGRWEANFCTSWLSGHGDTPAEAICRAALLNRLVDQDASPVGAQ